MTFVYYCQFQVWMIWFCVGSCLEQCRSWKNTTRIGEMTKIVQKRHLLIPDKLQHLSERVWIQMCQVYNIFSIWPELHNQLYLEFLVTAPMGKSWNFLKIQYLAMKRYRLSIMYHPLVFYRKWWMKLTMISKTRKQQW